MDPKQTLKDLLTALHTSRREDAIEFCESLSSWLRNGGFLPEVSTTVAEWWAVIAGPMPRPTNTLEQ